jgi:hypothetical protein
VDEVQKLILQVEGQEKLKTLNEELAKERDFLEKLLVIQKQGVVGVNPQDIRNAAERMVNLNTEIARLQTQTRGFGQAALNLQYVLDDLTQTSGGWERKLASISNNVPGLVASLGAGAGLAGTIGLVSTALIALAPLAKAAWAALTEEGPELAKEQLKEIEDRIKKINDEFKKLAQKPTDFESQSAKAIGDFLGQRPAAEKAEAGILKVMAGDPSAGLKEMTPDERKEFDDLQRRIKRGVGEPMPPLIARRNELANIARQRFARSLVTGATEAGPAGEKARRTLQEIAQRNPGAFPTNFATHLAEMTPEALAAQEADGSKALDEHEEFGRRAHEAGQKRRQNTAARNRARDDVKRRIERDTAAKNHQLEQQARAEDRGPAFADKQLADEARDSEAPGETDHQRQLRQARRASVSMSQDLGYGTPSADQADQLASAALSNMANGMNGQQAVWAAVMKKVEAINAAAQQFRQMQAQQLMGSDNSGQFSLMTPLF